MEENNARSNFIWDAIEKDLADGRYTESIPVFLTNLMGLCISATAKP